MGLLDTIGQQFGFGGPPSPPGGGTGGPTPTLQQPQQQGLTPSQIASLREYVRALQQHSLQPIAPVAPKAAPLAGLAKGAESFITGMLSGQAGAAEAQNRENLARQYEAAGVPGAPPTTSSTAPSSAPGGDGGGGDLLSKVIAIESGGDPTNTTPSGSYRGLGQLSRAEEKKYGVNDSNWNDPKVATQALASKLGEDRSSLRQHLGREPTDAEVYLAHQQGIGGAISHLNNPDLPAWANMRNTAEGQQKGDSWARQAIWGNMTPEMKSHYGSVDNVSSGDFSKMWANRYANIGGYSKALDPNAAQSPTRAPINQIMANAIRANASPQDLQILDNIYKQGQPTFDSDPYGRERMIVPGRQPQYTGRQTGPGKEGKVKIGDTEVPTVESIGPDGNIVSKIVAPGANGNPQGGSSGGSFLETGPIGDIKHAQNRLAAEKAGMEKTETGRAEQYEERRKSIMKRAQDVRDEIPQLELAKKVISDPNYSSGFLSGEQSKLDQIGQKLGVTSGKMATTYQLAKKLGAAGSLANVRMLGELGAVRVPEMHMVEKSTYDPENLPEVNHAVIDMNLRSAKREDEVAQLARDYLKHNNRLDEGFEQTVADNFKNKPLFSPDEINSFDSLLDRNREAKEAKAKAASGVSPPVRVRRYNRDTGKFEDVK